MSALHSIADLRVVESLTTANDGDLNRSMQHFILDSQDGVIAMKRKYKRIGFTAAQKADPLGPLAKR